MPDYYFLPFFVLIHLVAFMIYGNAISMKFQEITRKNKILKIPEIDQKRTLDQIKSLEVKIAKLKKIYPFVLTVILGIHLLSCKYYPKAYEPSDFKWAFTIAFVFLAFYFIVNFLKGAGTIDKNRLYDQTDFDW